MRESEAEFGDLGTEWTADEALTWVKVPWQSGAVGMNQGELSEFPYFGLTVAGYSVKGQSLATKLGCVNLVLLAWIPSTQNMTISLQL